MIDKVYCWDCNDLVTFRKTLPICWHCEGPLLESDEAIRFESKVEITALVEHWGKDIEYIKEQLGWLVNELIRENLEHIEIKIKGEKDDNRSYRE
tara:strand:- start:1892 stop:2176 length:285 start_codon:yes stop_codon:yes gene_type:complete